MNMFIIGFIVGGTIGALTMAVMTYVMSKDEEEHNEDDKD